MGTGFDPRDNARIFEIHPIHTLEIGGELHSCELITPTSMVREWTADLNRLDERREIRYWKGNDMLVFSDVEVEEDGYFRVTGHVSDITLNLYTSRPAWFILNGPDLAKQVKVTCLARHASCPSASAFQFHTGDRNQIALDRFG